MSDYEQSNLTGKNAESSINDEIFFVWDEEKNQKNIHKHGISFETAMLVFEDEMRIEIFDSVHSINENRYQTIGVVEDVIFVVYTERNDIIRMISARIANKQERSMYYGEDVNT